MKKLQRDALLSDLSAVNEVLSSLPDDDFIGRMGFEARKSEIEAELAKIEDGLDTLASVALMFHGKPVRGSRSIETNFAASALEAYQDLVAKRLATFENGGLAQRGPIPGKQAASLNITGIVHGSFGFTLEESDPDSPQLIKSSLKEAVENVTDVLQSFSAQDDENFISAMDDMDARLFTSARAFFRILYENEATLRIVEGENDQKLDAEAIDRGYRRCEEASVEEKEVTVTGTLIGVVPYGRRFELKMSESDVIKGKIGPLFSLDYLERLEKEEQMVGRQWTAKLLRKSVDRPGRRTIISYTLVELLPLESM